MTFNIAKKAVDFFIHRCKGHDNFPASITFYGGEPLLKFDLIKEIVEYVKSKGFYEKFSISFTTNGTLLNDEVIGYLIKNNISILVSLDGPKDSHDKYRVFKKGDGTFYVIIKNLKRIKRYNPEYFQTRISFNAVVSPPYKFDSLINFFYRIDFFRSFKDKVRINFVDAFETTFFKDYNLEEGEGNLREELIELSERYKKALLTGTYNKLTIEKSLFLEDFYNIACRDINTLESKFPPLFYW